MVDKNCYLYYSEEPGRLFVLHQCFENLVLNLDGLRHGRARQTQTLLTSTPCLLEQNTIYYLLNQTQLIPTPC